MILNNFLAIKAQPQHSKAQRLKAQPDGHAGHITVGALSVKLPFGSCTRRKLSKQKRQLDAIEVIGILELRPVPALIHHHELRTTDAIGQPASDLDRAARIMGGPQHQGRSLDARPLLGRHRF